MRIENISIKGFRQYRNVNFDFTPNKGNDLHIILGNNGIGKTNLLNAISWCLYGDEPHLGNEAKARQRINILDLEEAINNGDDKCRVSVSVTINVDEKKIIFDRSQEFKVPDDYQEFESGDKTVFEYRPEHTVTVFFTNSGEPQIFTEDDEIYNIKKQYLPEDIREYFFFDGEQLDKYFISGQGKKIYDAIFNISQVNLLNSMSNRLESIVKEFNRSAGKKNSNVKELNEKVIEAEKKVKELAEKISVCQNQINEAAAEIKICNEFLSGKEGVPEKEKEYQNINEKLEVKQSEQEEYNREFRKFLREYKILFSLYPRLKQTLDLINNKEDAGQLPPNIDINFLKRMLEYHKCFVCNRDMDKDEEDNIKVLIKKLSVPSEVSHLLVKIKSPLEDSVTKCKEYKTERENLINRGKHLRKEINDYVKDLEDIDNYLKNYQDKDKIADYAIKRSQFTSAKQKSEEERISLEVQKNIAEKEQNEARKALDKAIKNQTDLTLLNQKIEFSKNSKRIVDEIIDEMMTEAKENMIDETMNIFQKLDWKNDTFDHIELDDEYVLELYDSYGYPMIGACSAAERALLALSFTLALQKVSGYDSMLFIDTPVGRVDLDNRTNFALVLKEISESKQIIMTFTPSEYSKEIKDTLEPYTSTFKELTTVDEKQTTIK